MLHHHRSNVSGFWVTESPGQTGNINQQVGKIYQSVTMELLCCYFIQNTSKYFDLKRNVTSLVWGIVLSVLSILNNVGQFSINMKY